MTRYVQSVATLIVALSIHTAAHAQYGQCMGEPVPVIAFPPIQCPANTPGYDRDKPPNMAREDNSENMAEYANRPVATLCGNLTTVPSALRERFKQLFRLRYVLIAEEPAMIRSCDLLSLQAKRLEVAQVNAQIATLFGLDPHWKFATLPQDYKLPTTLAGASMASASAASETAGGAGAISGTKAAMAAGELGILGSTLALKGDTPDPEELCKQLVADVQRRTGVVQQRYYQLNTDDDELYSTAFSIPVPGKTGTWLGHVESYNQARNGLSNSVRATERAQCAVPKAAYYWRDKEPPLRPRVK